MKIDGVLYDNPFSIQLKLMHAVPHWEKAAIDVHDTIDTARAIFKSQFKQEPTPEQVLPIWLELLRRADTYQPIKPLD